MSVKKDYEIKTHTVTEKVLVKETRYCDICKKEIENNKSYWRLTTHHNDWGNDSIDSYEYKDICSSSCLNKEIEKYIKRSNDGLNTEFIEIEHNNSPCLYIEKDW